MKNNPSFLLLGLLSYGIGVAMGFFLILVAAWADMESSAYDFPRLASAGLPGFHCPILMTPDEASTISLSVSNPTKDRISPSVKTQISTRLLPEQFIENVQLTPGESTKLEWAVDSENIDMGRFIFAKVLLFSAYPLPSRETTCGIFIVDLPGSGQTILPVLVALSLLGMGWGLHWVRRFRTFNEWLSKHMGSMIYLAGMIVLGLVLSFMGGWTLSLLVLVVALLLIIILLGQLFAGKSK